MKALVTGGGGFLGRFVARELSASGREVVVLGRKHYDFLEREGIPTVVADIADLEPLIAAFRGVEEVHHCAALAGISVDRGPFERTNVLGTANVIAACIANGVKRLVHTSSPSVSYSGGDEIALDESAPYPARYLAHYPETKAEAERMVLESSRTGRLPAVILRPHLIFGPEDTNLIPRLIDRARRGRLRRVGPGGNRADVTYVGNAALAHRLAADRLRDGAPVDGKVYFITNGEPVDVWGFIDRILAGVGLPPVDRSLPAGLAYGIGAALEAAYRLFGLAGEPVMTRFLARQLSTTHTYSIAAARRDLGYAPAVSIDEGIARTCAWFKNR